MKKYDDEFNIKEYLDSYKKEISKDIKENIIIEEWKNIVGEILYNHVFFMKIEKNKMIVKTEHSIYKSLVKTKESWIIGKFNKIFPQYKIKSIQSY